MPGATDRVADDQPVRERSCVVGARRADREGLVAPAHEDDGFAPRVPEQRLPFGERVPVHAALLEVRTAQWLVFAAHAHLRYGLAPIRSS